MPRSSRSTTSSALCSSIASSWPVNFPNFFRKWSFNFYLINGNFLFWGFVYERGMGIFVLGVFLGMGIFIFEVLHDISVWLISKGSNMIWGVFLYASRQCKSNCNISFFLWKIFDHNLAKWLVKSHIIMIFFCVMLLLLKILPQYAIHHFNVGICVQWSIISSSILLFINTIFA
jgi:hypothetical protein